MDDDVKSAADSLGASEKPVYRPPTPQAQPPRRLPTALLIVIGVIVLAAGVFALWKFVFHSASSSSGAKTTSTTNTTQTPARSTKIPDDIPEAEPTETYSSTALSLAFKYPKTWKVSESGGGIRIESPTFNFPAAGSGNVDGFFRVYIRQGAREVDGTYIGDGLAIKPSEILTYTQPANGQRTTTLLSSFGYESTDIFSFFFIAGNFQLNTGDTLGPDYGKEPDTYIIAGGYTTPAAADDLAMSSVAVDYYATTNAYKQAVAIVASLQLK